MQSLSPTFSHHNSRKLTVLLGKITDRSLLEDLVIQPQLASASAYFSGKQFSSALAQCENILAFDKNNAAAQELKRKVEKIQQEEEQRQDQKRRIRETLLKAETSLGSDDFENAIVHCDVVLNNFDSANEIAHAVREEAERLKRELKLQERERQEKEQKDREESERRRQEEACKHATEARKKLLKIGISILIMIFAIAGGYYYWKQLKEQEAADIVEFLNKAEKIGLRLFSYDFNQPSKFTKYKAINNEIKNGTKYISLSGELLEGEHRLFYWNWSNIKKTETHEIFGVTMTYYREAPRDFILEADVKSLNSNSYIGPYFRTNKKENTFFLILFKENKILLCKARQIYGDPRRGVALDYTMGQHADFSKFSEVFNINEIYLQANLIDVDVTKNFKIKIACNKYKIMIYCNDRLLDSIHIEKYNAENIDASGNAGFFIENKAQGEISKFNIYSLDPN